MTTRPVAVHRPANTVALMFPREVAAAFRVDPKTVTRWANRGFLHPVITPAGHRRYRTDEVEALLNRTEGMPAR